MQNVVSWAGLKLDHILKLEWRCHLMMVFIFHTVLSSCCKIHPHLFHSAQERLEDCRWFVHCLSVHGDLDVNDPLRFHCHYGANKCPMTSTRWTLQRMRKYEEEYRRQQDKLCLHEIKSVSSSDNVTWKYDKLYVMKSGRIQLRHSTRFHKFVH